MAIYNIGPTDNLISTISSANAGDVINLADGSYGSINISNENKNNSSASAVPAAYPWLQGFIDDPARPENQTLLIIQGGVSAILTSLIVTDCTGLHFKGFTVSNPTISQESQLVRLRGSQNCIIDQLHVIGAPLPSDTEGYPLGTGFGRGQGIVLGNSSAFPGDECHYISIRGCYLEQVNDGIKCFGAGGLANAGTMYWVYKNYVYEAATDAYHVDGTTDGRYERNRGPNHFHPGQFFSNNKLQAYHNDFFQSSTQGAERIYIGYNLRVPGFEGGSRESEHADHADDEPFGLSSSLTCQGLFLSDTHYHDILLEQNLIISGNQNHIYIGDDDEPTTSGIIIRNNTCLRDPYFSIDDSGNKNNVTISIRGGGSGSYSRNVRSAGANDVSLSGTTLLSIGYGSWAGSFRMSNYYQIDTTAAIAAWQLALSDLQPVPGSLTDPDTYGAETFGAYDLLTELAANDFNWPPPVDTSPAAPAIGGQPIISGNETAGEILYATAAPVTGYPVPTRTWQWYNSTGIIPGATSSFYQTQQSDVGKTIYVEQIETNSTSPFTATATSVHTGIIGTGVSPSKGLRIGTSLLSIGGKFIIVN